MIEMESLIKFPQITNYSLFVAFFFFFSSVLCLTIECGRDINLGGLHCFQLPLKTPFSICTWFKIRKKVRHIIRMPNVWTEDLTFSKEYVYSYVY